MKLTSVTSSAIKAIGHDADKKILHVQFHTGAVYEFRGVDENAHAELMGAPSVGSHFNNHVLGKYESTKYGI